MPTDGFIQLDPNGRAQWEGELTVSPTVSARIIVVEMPRRRGVNPQDAPTLYHWEAFIEDTGLRKSAPIAYHGDTVHSLSECESGIKALVARLKEPSGFEKVKEDARLRTLRHELKRYGCELENHRKV